jgi:hypothetical protein
MKVISLVSYLRPFLGHLSALEAGKSLLNGTRKGKFLDLASGPQHASLPRRVHVPEENYRKAWSDNGRSFQG